MDFLADRIDFSHRNFFIRMVPNIHNEKVAGKISAKGTGVQKKMELSRSIG